MVVLMSKDEEFDSVEHLCDYTIDLFYCLERHAMSTTHALLCFIHDAITVLLFMSVAWRRLLHSIV
ncbi:uncharacterized protein M421DRAFT_384171 [Didymella exigua CBS 183.55]|uniref:Uncharacterized protein n=1 Tax=Didymella exigua CBS 183.55 TaxID=1150837 RepID=A0A6A5RRK5_9PLEO|nr:uncharacterized protein M421DRAFT_384171 [Didymella exigua CBS 183.55]KAF1930083.1 hypothetical protein M421DRAFT_384171 [Didymella exigua CBS 183.55]